MSAIIEDGVLRSDLGQIEAPRFSVSFARDEAEVRESQQLRYQIFAEEMGAQIDGGDAGLDRDAYDPWCRHLLVRDRDSGDRIVACTRILTDDQAPNAGGFYSSGEFDLAMVDSLPGRVMEIGRTCVAREYRNGVVIATLWQGIAGYITAHGFDYLFGCASIGLEDGGAQAHAIIQQIKSKYMTPDYQRVRPYYPLPAVDARPSSVDRLESCSRVSAPTPAPTSLRSDAVSLAHARNADKTRMPPLLKAYLSLGAKACGDAYWDRDFNCADVFMLLNVTDLNPRYARHFLDRSAAASDERLAAHG